MYVDSITEPLSFLMLKHVVLFYDQRKKKGRQEKRNSSFFSGRPFGDTYDRLDRSIAPLISYVVWILCVVVVVVLVVSPFVSLSN